MEKEKITSFTKLISWQKAFSLVILIYKITKNFPEEELYGIISQMRRAAVSVTSNISEGFSRIYKKEKIQFLYLSLGSLTELENLLLIARELGFLNKQSFDQASQLCVEVSKLITKSIKSLKSIQFFLRKLNTKC
jgi:four helix bundle protein